MGVLEQFSAIQWLPIHVLLYSFEARSLVSPDLTDPTIHELAFPLRFPALAFNPELFFVGCVPVIMRNESVHLSALPRAANEMVRNFIK